MAETNRFTPFYRNNAAADSFISLLVCAAVKVNVVFYVFGVERVAVYYALVAVSFL